MGRYNEEKTAALMEEVLISSVSTENSSRFFSSRTRVLLVRTPVIPSLKAAVMREFIALTLREETSIFFWKYTLIATSNGIIAKTIKVSLKL